MQKQQNQRGSSMAEQPSLEKFLKKTASETNAEIKKLIPRSPDSAWMDRLLGKPAYAYDTKSAKASVSAPIWDLLDRGGKRWRPALLVLCCEAVGGNHKDAKPFLPLPEIIHNGTLMVDDVEDNAGMRRGKPATHRIFGADVAINTGNLMYFIPLAILSKQAAGAKKLDEEKRARIYDLYVHEMLRLSFGQAFDIYWHQGKLKTVTESQYMQMCAYKTGCLARFAAGLGAIIGNAKPAQKQAMEEFASALGIAFQIRDDILSLMPTKHWGKDYGEDITEGKRTLMVIHALSNASRADAAELTRILNSHTKRKAEIKKAISMLQKHGSINYADSVAKETIKNAWKALDPLLKKSKAKSLLHAFAEYAVKREI